MTRFLGEWNCDQLRSVANFSSAWARFVVSIRWVGSDALLVIFDDLLIETQRGELGQVGNCYLIVSVIDGGDDEGKKGCWAR